MAPVLVRFDSHQLGTLMPVGGHPPHQIQALDRTQPGLPMKKGRAGTMTHEPRGILKPGRRPPPRPAGPPRRLIESTNGKVGPKGGWHQKAPTSAHGPMSFWWWL